MICGICGKNSKHKYCKDCVSEFYEGEIEENQIDNLRQCTVCGWLTLNSDWTCDVCKKALEEEKEWSIKNNVR